MLTAETAARRQSLIVSASTVAEGVQQPLDLSQATIRRSPTLLSLFMNECKSITPLSSPL